MSGLSSLGSFSSAGAINLTEHSLDTPPATNLSSFGVPLKVIPFDNDENQIDGKETQELPPYTGPSSEPIPIPKRVATPKPTFQHNPTTTYQRNPTTTIRPVAHHINQQLYSRQQPSDSRQQPNPSRVFQPITNTRLPQPQQSTRQSVEYHENGRPISPPINIPQRPAQEDAFHVGRPPTFLSLRG